MYIRQSGHDCRIYMPWLWCRLGSKGAGADLYEKIFNLKLSGKEVYYTFLETLLAKIKLCSKLHCQTVFELKAFSYDDGLDS